MNSLNYIQGVPDSVGQQYNLLISGGTTYGNENGLFIGHNTNTASANNGAGLHLFQDLQAKHGYLEHRAANEKAFIIRHKDDAKPEDEPVNMLQLKLDDGTVADRFGAEVKGRVKASQYHVSSSDMRLADTSGLYMDVSGNQTGMFRVNKGASGSGGFSFQTHDAAGALVANSGLLVSGSGVVTAQYYTATTDTQDTEAVALAGLDASGNLVRNFASNLRFRQAEARLSSIEGELTGDVPDKLNEVITRLNNLNFFSSNIQNLPTYYKRTF